MERGQQRQADLRESEVSLFDLASSRPSRMTEKDEREREREDQLHKCSSILGVRGPVGPVMGVDTHTAGCTRQLDTAESLRRQYCRLG